MACSVTYLTSVSHDGTVEPGFVSNLMLCVYENFTHITYKHSHSHIQTLSQISPATGLTTFLRRCVTSELWSASTSTATHYARCRTTCGTSRTSTTSTSGEPTMVTALVER